MSAVWTLFHRQARTDSISPRALQVGSPAFLNDNPSYGKHYYLAALAPLVSEPRQELAAQSPQLSPESTPPCGVGATDAKPGRVLACLPSTGPFEGLLLGSLVGKGSFGRVYRGLWRGQLVGVKVGACPQPQGNLAFCMPFSCHPLCHSRFDSFYRSCNSFCHLFCHSLCHSLVNA